MVEREVKMLSKFDERRLLGWGDYLMENDKIIEEIKLDVKMNKLFLELLNKGEKIQEILNKECTEDYSSYIKIINHYICLQDVVINEIENYLKQHEWQKKLIELEENAKKNKQKKDLTQIPISKYNRCRV